MMQRWELKDLRTNETQRMRQNPRSMASIQKPRRGTADIDARGVARVLRTPVGGFLWEFQGNVHTQEEYDELLSWATRELVQITDHLGRRHKVIPLAFLPTPIERTGTRNPWLYSYTFRSIYLGRLP